MENEQSLFVIQQWVQAALLNPSSTSTNEVSQYVRPSGKLNAEEHLAIYQRSYVARLRECMAKQFEALQFALGRELFQQFADLYLQTYPSKSYTLLHLGQKFSQFLEETRPDKDQEVKETWPDFLIELANFEYQICLIFDRVENEMYEWGSEEDNEKDLAIMPTSFLHQSNFPVLAYYMQFQKGQEPELPFEQASYCLIYRNNYRVAFRQLTFWQFRFLEWMKEDKGVEASIKALSQESQKPLSYVQDIWKSWRKEWLAAGILVRM